MKIFFHSIRWRIQAWHGLILGIAIAAFCVAAYQLASFNQMRRVDRQLQKLERRLVRSMSQQAVSANGVAPPSADSVQKPKLRREGEHLFR